MYKICCGGVGIQFSSGDFSHSARNTQIEGVTLQWSHCFGSTMTQALVVQFKERLVSHTFDAGMVNAVRSYCSRTSVSG